MKSESQINDMLAGRKSFGEKVARDIEKRAHLKPGSLDRTVSEPPTAAASKEVVVAASDLPPAGYLRLPQLALPVGAGDGDDTLDDEPGVVRWLDVSMHWATTHFPGHADHIRILPVHGDSMVGAGINNDDLLFVDTSITHYDGDGFYVLRFRHGWQVKRLRANVLSQQLEIVSIPAHGEQVAPVPAAHESDLAVAGRVAGWWTLRTS